jgi:predicted dithiol-disulfide oxidoreductase (DUF899 family)
MATAQLNNQTHKIASRDEWLAARKTLLAREKAATRERDEIARLRRELPWVRVEKDYPAWSQGCKSCSLVADHYDPAVIHLAQRDTTMITVSKAPVEKIAAFRERMGWNFRWVSSNGNDFNRDFQVSFNEAEQASGLPIYNFATIPFPISEAPGLSVFFKDESGEIYHTYSTYARGLDAVLGVFTLLDMVPKGRDEENIEIMSWVRHHDRYDGRPFVDPWMEKAGK